jgi:FPC/CPF motif-containing protein YcgG
MKTQVKSKKAMRKIYRMVQLCANQITHFVGYIESLNADNFSCNRKNARTTSNAKFIKCVSSPKEGKTQVGWATTVSEKCESEPKQTMFLLMGPLVVYLISTK